MDFCFLCLSCCSGAPGAIFGGDIVGALRLLEVLVEEGLSSGVLVVVEGEV